MILNVTGLGRALTPEVPRAKNHKWEAITSWGWGGTGHVLNQCFRIWEVSLLVETPGHASVSLFPEFPMSPLKMRQQED